VQPDPHEVKAWLMTSGTVLCVDQSFLDYAGWWAAALGGWGGAAAALLTVVAVA
jgi:hypothetical protein